MTTIDSFSQLKLAPAILSALEKINYTTPTPVQAASIPYLLDGKDLLAQAQTGTGKTAAFALPTLSNIDLAQKHTQVLVLAPTRELAIQVANAYKEYATNLNGFRIATIYGGADYKTQLNDLKKGAHVVVGTPGRVMDHLRRGTLVIKTLKTIVLDEADEMLNMGFIDDIEWILEQITQKHQTALFSATMPASIKKIAKNYLHNPEKVNIKPTEKNTLNIEQQYMLVNNKQKLEVLRRYIELEQTDAIIIFTRTKSNSDEVAKALVRNGLNAAALNGDMQQNLRKKVIEQVKYNKLDIIVATDVAARGIDLERITHVINYDGPTNMESYTHRIGRTGRAGRKGKALLFVTQNDRRLLRDIEKTTHQTIEEVKPPSKHEIMVVRQQQLIEKINGIIQKSKKLKPYYQLLDDVAQHSGAYAEDIAAALLYLQDQDDPITDLPAETHKPRKDSDKKQKNKNFSRTKKSKSGSKSGAKSSAKPKSKPKSRKKRQS